MKIAVAYKWAADPSEASVNADGEVDWSRAKPAISEYDAVAIQVARELADAAGSGLIGLTAGPLEVAAPLAAKAALSRGLDSLTAVADDSLAGADATRTGRALAGAVQRDGKISLVIMGDCSVDEGAGLVPAVTAGWLGWRAMLEANRIEIDGTGLLIERQAGGAVEKISFAGPAVIAVAAGAVKPKPPGMKDVLAAAKKEVIQLTAAQVGVGLAQGEVLARARLETPARRGVLVDATDPAAAVARLIGSLATDGILAGGPK
ncbi:MAG: hypothetical protein LBJ02_11170 [Bifidobacteriaceae bacterium]|jgi:electron transfer flavoprotein beta subunit|nr:hypothetical protein [Bifidobacteriaceae bacterium]